MKNLKMNKGSIDRVKFGVKYILIVFCLAFSFQSQSQSIITDGNTYRYNGYNFDSKTIGDVLNTSEEASILFSKSRRAQKQADWFGYSAVGSLTMSGICFFKASQATGFLGGLGEAIAGAGFGLLGAILGTTGIIIKGGQKKHVNNAVNHFNWEMNQEMEQEAPNLELSVAGNGVGLFYSF